MSNHDLPPLSALFGDEMFRLRGAESWDDARRLGVPNLTRLVQIAQGQLSRALYAGEDPGALRELRRAVGALEAIERESAGKPLLPRLRSESFARGDRIFVYLGDTPGTKADLGWEPGVVAAIEKAHKREWAGAADRGYYWRITATMEREVFPGSAEVPFSTTEPRALRAGELAYLLRAEGEDPEFLRIFVANAIREWDPIWCIERGVASQREAMDYGAWLTAARGQV